MEHKGLRFNEGKLRYDLIHPFAEEQLARVLTKGASKYRERNWENGMKWSNVISSLKRHLAEIEKGEDFDEETKELHASHLLCNAHFLAAYYKIYPQGDDRPHQYLKQKRIGLDIDGVIADFQGAINTILNRKEYSPVDWNDPLIYNCYQQVKNEPDFWANLNPLVQVKDIPFEPSCYITTRDCSIELTEEWLSKYNFAKVPVYKVLNSKVQAAKDANIDFFIDDYYNNFVELNNASVCTFLLDRSYNSKYNVGYKRILDFNDFKNRFL